MRFFFTIQASISHVNPMLPVARALKKRGHDIHFVTGRSLFPFIHSKGFQTIDSNVGLTPEEFPERDELIPQERGAFDIGYVFASYSPPLVFEGLKSIIETEPPDLIIRDQLEFGGYLLGEVYDIPHVTLNISAGWQMAKDFLMNLIETPLMQHRQKLNLPDVSIIESLFRYLRLDMTPESLLPPNYFKTKTTRNFNQFKESHQDKLPDWVDAMPFEKTILITLGTVWNTDDATFHTLISAARTESANVIVATGREDSSLDNANYPEHVKIVNYIPFTALLPRLSASIFHGGFVTLLTLLNGGIPMIIIPLAADHFLNGRLVEMAQVGRTIQAPDASRVHKVLKEVLTNPIFRGNAQRIQADMQAMPGVEDACDLLEQVAVTKQAIKL